MTDALPVLVFQARPKSVPGDLRLSWRLSMTLLALHYCRRTRASFIKLHILNDVLRSHVARGQLRKFLDGSLDHDICTIRVEPAFSRNLDFLIGKGLAKWLVASGRLSVEMTSQGADIVKVLNAEESLFADEKEFLATTGRRLTEQVVKRIIAAGRRPR